MSIFTGYKLKGKNGCRYLSSITAKNRKNNKQLGIKGIFGEINMNIPLIPNLSNPKWLIIQEVFKSVGSARAKKIASRLKIPDIEMFIACIKILILGDTFESEYSYVISEINTNKSLKSFMGLKNVPDIEFLYNYKYISKLDNNRHKRACTDVNPERGLFYNLSN